MKRLVIPFVAAFGLSLGIATGVVIVRAPKVAAVTAKASPSKLGSPHAAQAKHDAASAASPLPGNLPNVQSAPATAPVMTPASAGVSVALASAHPTAQNSGQTEAALGTQKSLPTSNESKAPSATAQVPVQDTTVGRKIAKVFGAMQARDAARVLEQMDDVDVRTILSSLNNKQQAAILGTFPTQRAATIMRATLRNVGSDQ